MGERRRSRAVPRVGVLAAAALIGGGLIVAARGDGDGRGDGRDRRRPDPPAVAWVDSSNRAGWWRPIVEQGGSLYYAYDAPGSRPRTHTVVVVRRSPAGATESSCLRAGDGTGGGTGGGTGDDTGSGTGHGTGGNTSGGTGACLQFPDDVGHHQPSLAVDGAGHVHVFVAMHSSPWRGRYFRSDHPASVDRFVERGGEMPDQTWTHTYPVPATGPDGDLWLTTRSRSAPDAGGVGGRLYRYDVATATWSRVATFAYHPGLWVYPDDLQVDPEGRVHIAFEWVMKHTSAFPHVGAYATYDPATGRFANAAGQVLPAPLGLGSPTAYQPWPESYDPHARRNGRGVETAKLVLDAEARPHVVYRYMPHPGGRLQVMHAWWDGTQWHRATVYAGRHDTHPTVDATLAGDRLRVYYTKVSAPGAPTAFVAERTPGGGYTEGSLAPGRPGIERLSAITRADGSDLVYLSAPRLFGEEGADGGELYLATVPR